MAGSVLAHLELWEYEQPPKANAPFCVLAKYEIRQLISAATSGNDRLFREGLQRLQDDAPVAEAALAVRTETAVSLFLRCLKQARDETVGRFREALATVGLEPKWSLKEELLGYGCAFSPVALAAIAHWLDRDGPNFCLVGNRVLMIGEEYAPPSAQPPEEGPAPTPDDEPIPAPEADDLQVRLGEAIAELGGGAPPVDTSMQDKPPEGVLLTLLSASDIADRVGRKRESVTSFLTRFAAKCPDCRVSTETKRKNEPSYLYRTADVWPALEQWLKDTNAD
jgi:hypothetical protein